MDYLDQSVNSFTNTFGARLPTIIGALLVLLIGIFIAKALRKLIGNQLAKLNLNQRLGMNPEAKGSVDIHQLIAGLIYYLVLVYAIIISLDMLGVGGVLAPLQNMLNSFVNFLPNLLAAGIIGYAGYILGNLAGSLAASGMAYLDRVVTQVDLQGSVNVVNLVRQLVFLFVFVPILIIAINTLNIDVISIPATQMFGDLMSFIPRILSAAIIIGVAYVGGKILTEWVGTLLQNMGLDTLASRLGLTAVLGNQSLAILIKNIAFLFILFTAIISAAEKLGLPQVVDILREIFDMTGQIFFGLLILAAGSLLANLVRTNVAAQNENNRAVAGIAYYAILLIFVAMAFRAMGIADSIVDLAFGAIVGAIALAIALSFGLGGREAAGKQMEYWLKKLRGEDPTKLL
ncbi:MAG: mechanosensitive ion channel [Rudanella sp.]|nr:mechanosensitive ion channel [Rudanella sp.]